MKDIYSLHQGELQVFKYYRSLKTKQEDVDYLFKDTWESSCDQITHNGSKVFIFVDGLNNEFDNIRSQILNSGELTRIQEVYFKIEAEDQRIMIGNSSGTQHENKIVDLVYLCQQRLIQSSRFRKYTHCKKNGQTIHFWWDLHLQKKTTRNNEDLKRRTIIIGKINLLLLVGIFTSDMSMTEELKKRIKRQQIKISIFRQNILVKHRI